MAENGNDRIFVIVELQNPGGPPPDKISTLFYLKKLESNDSEKFVKEFDFNQLAQVIVNKIKDNWYHGRSTLEEAKMAVMDRSVHYYHLIIVEAIVPHNYLDRDIPKNSRTDYKLSAENIVSVQPARNDLHLPSHLRTSLESIWPNEMKVDNPNAAKIESVQSPLKAPVGKETLFGGNYINQQGESHNSLSQESDSDEQSTPKL